METITIDATNKRIGRVASDAATALRGKDSPQFARNQIPQRTVTIENAGAVKIDESKYRTEEYVRYSGYPGGKKVETLETVINTKGHAEVIRRAVYGMLPSNRLRARLMKQLIVNE